MKPSDEPVDVLLVGAGFAGIYLLDRLRDEGFKVKTHEAASGLGGIWHWNCYPGARVDSKADYYQFALKDVWHDWDWSERFPGWEEMRANAYVYEFWRDKVCARIQDPTVAELLAPTIAPHPFGTRRVALEQTYYDLFNERHVELVDIQTNPIDEITTQGMRTRNTEFEFDLLVIATGFDSVTGGLTQIDIRGADGTSLEDKWSTGVRTYQGICTAGFPNLLFTYGPQAPTAFCNGPTSAEYQGECIVDCLRSLRDKQITRFEARIEEEKRWGELCRQLAAPTLFDQANSWYMGANIPGKHREMLMYTGGLPLYLEELRKSHAAGYQDYLLD